MSIKRVVGFCVAALLGCVTVAWAQVTAGGFAEVCQDWSLTITAVGGAIVMVTSLAFAWAEMKNRVGDTEEAVKRVAERQDQQEARVVKVEEKQHELDERIESHFRTIIEKLDGRG